MIIKRKVKLGNNNYYITLECFYKNINNITVLLLKNFDRSEFDSGNLSILIKKIEDTYNFKLCEEKYNSDIIFINDALYIYDHIPFITGIGDFYISSSDNLFSSSSYITKEELDNYISTNHINMIKNNNFNLCDERTWNI